ncbi:HEPN domain-containing protein [Cohnella hashimotonis]|uniref:HEPN domain-containing protein n=1 Tax=Cohnella hashimotonis TaxID=2826895 RepID=A0ABT6TTH1_9BACL|nr:HEPN domain-containing protein [Cohnella hashimotonis]MDI4649585.1 HEPN domain-containing protein [Cohnella hashimotonis]
MTTSNRFNEFKLRYEELKTRFIPELSEDLDYSDEQLDDLRAFRVLCHSEIEAYLEDRARETSSQALRKFQETGNANKVLLCLLAFSDTQWEGPPSSIQNLQNSVLYTIRSRIQKAVKIFNSKITDNHGIREKNLLQILCPIGIQFDELDNTWVNSMDSYGKKRGEVAHTSFRTQQVIDPATEISTTDYLVDELKKVDFLLNSLNS